MWQVAVAINVNTGATVYVVTNGSQEVARFGGSKGSRYLPMWWNRNRATRFAAGLNRGATKSLTQVYDDRDALERMSREAQAELDGVEAPKQLAAPNDDVKIVRADEPGPDAGRAEIEAWNRKYHMIPAK